MRLAPLNKFVYWPGLALGTTDHALPFQCSTNVPLLERPMAHALVGDIAVTAEKLPKADKSVRTADQRTPFQCSATGRPGYPSSSGPIPHTSELDAAEIASMYAPPLPTSTPEICVPWLPFQWRKSGWKARPLTRYMPAAHASL